ncbi:MAG: hypothetical protein ACRD5M_14730 [Candidatus Acidiferrales bacterium]
MEKQTYGTNAAGNLPVSRTKRIDEAQKRFEKHIESRSTEIAKLVAMLAESRYPGLRKYGDLRGDELEDLLLKEARLRWVVRVAKYSEAANRRALWLEAEKELAQLEKAAEAMLHAECV